jgi:hypothetical protein
VYWDGTVIDGPGVGCRFAGGDGSETGYLLMPGDSGNELNLKRYKNGSGGDVDQAYWALSHSSHYWVRLRAWGGRLWGKGWKIDESEPEDWMVEYIDHDPLPVGGVGMCNYHGNSWCEFFSAATKGGSAFLSGELCT